MEQKMKQLFEYLLALRNLNYEPISDVRKYEKYWYLDELENNEGCYLGGSGQESTAILEIHQQQFKNDYPEITSQLNQLLLLLEFDYTKEGSVIFPVSDLEQLLKHKYQLLCEKAQENVTDVDLEPYERYLIQHHGASVNRIELREQLQEVTTFLEQIMSAYESWVSQWLEWAEKQKNKRRVQKLYDYYFTLMQMMKVEQKPIEIVLGTGLFKFHSKNEMYHPLLTTKLELEFDAEQGIAKLIPSAKGVQLEVEMFSNFEISNHTDIMELRELIKGDMINPFNESEYEAILKQFIHYMHPNGVYIENHEDDRMYKYPAIINRHVIFIRQKSDMLLKQDLRTTIEYIEEGHPLPKTIQAITDVEALKISERELMEWQAVGENILFPLPANEEQKDIARRLASQVAITVQGPPGTGKSHTIANLISHLLANGKKVLVTSEKDKALRVLLDKLPEELQSFCVAYLGNDRQAIHQIEQSIRYLSEGMASFDSKLLDKEIQALSRQHDLIRRQIHITKHNMIRFKELDAKGQLWKDKMCQPYEMAQIVADKSPQYPWFKDTIEMDTPCPLSEEDFVTLWELKCLLPKRHQYIVNDEFIMLSELLTIEEYKHLLNQKRIYEEKIANVEKRNIHFDLPKDEGFVSELATQIDLLINKLEKLTQSFEMSILQDSLVNSDRKTLWMTIYSRLNELLYLINERELLIMDDEIICHELDHPKFDQWITILRDKIQSNKLIGGFFLTFHKDLKAFYESTRINGHSISKIEDLKRLIAYKEKNELLQQFKKTWNKQVHPLGGKKIEDFNTTSLFQLNQKLAQLKTILDGVNLIGEVNAQLMQVMPSFTGFNFDNLNGLGDLSYAIHVSQNKINLEKWNKAYDELLSEYKGLLLREQNHEVYQTLYNALVEQNGVAYGEILEKIQNLIKIKDQYSMFYRLLHQLKPVTPLFANLMIEQLEVKEKLPGSISDIFEYGKLNTYLTKLDEWKMEELESKLEMLEREENSVMRQLILKQTWRHQLDHVTPEQDRSLQVWMHKMSRIGKGTGKHSDKYRKEARQEMEKCQSAIPVWIMPVKDAIENFTVNPELFDVVIIDESSQCNILSLPILMRAKKAVIVGDEQQISPLVPGVNEAQVSELMKRYLYQIENGDTYDLQTSLYDIAKSIFSSKGKLMLKEHFRCVPEIIAFSNELCYDREMIPLKIPHRLEQLNPPVCATYVPGGMRCERKTNLEEATHIVKDIEQCIQDPVYVGKTMGVISLLGNEQAKLIQKMLIQSMGEAEYTKRQIVCGDAYSFQGDERDVIFLSLVIAPNMRYTALNKKLYTQRFNVAASRAKCQMRLYHSVLLDELSTEDLRYKLLAYCQNPYPSLVEKTLACETKLEIDVMNEIMKYGYIVKPKVQVGKYKIDLVVEGPRQRLAIECDGDLFYGVEKIEQDMERQRVLERAGWTFVRIRGSVFYRHKQKALQPVFDKLEILEIRPKNIS